MADSPNNTIPSSSNEEPKVLTREPIDHMKMPKDFDDGHIPKDPSKLYGLKMLDNGMAPLAKKGDIVVCDPLARPKDKGLVVLHYRNESKLPGVWRLGGNYFPLKLSDDSEVELAWFPVEQLNPPKIVDMPAEAVMAIHRVISVCHSPQPQEDAS